MFETSMQLVILARAHRFFPTLYAHTRSSLSSAWNAICQPQAFENTNSYTALKCPHIKRKQQQLQQHQIAIVTAAAAASVRDALRECDTLNVRRLLVSSPWITQLSCTLDSIVYGCMFVTSVCCYKKNWIKIYAQALKTVHSRATWPFRGRYQPVLVVYFFLYSVSDHSSLAWALQTKFIPLSNEC